MDVDFYTLERAVQDRFADATRAIGLPTPILREASADRRSAYWLAGLVLIVAILVWAVLHGLGELDSPVALAPVGLAIGLSVGVAGAIYCLLRALAIRHARATVPYQPGLYLFPAGVFDARSEPIRVFLHPDISDVSIIDGTALRVVTGGNEFVFRLPDAQVAEQAKEAVTRAGEQYLQVLHSANRREQAMLDPLIDSGFSSPFSPQLRLARREPVWAKLSLFVAVAVGAVAGPSLWKARNLVSERRLYAEAVQRNDIPGYHAYLARGGARPEVSDVLLPRAELGEAVRIGTVESLEQFGRDHPNSKIDAELNAALHAAVDEELAAAVHVGTVTALRDFRQRRAAYTFTAPAVEAATVAIYRALLAKFVVGKDPAVASFFERLLGYTKVHGPTVQIRFLRRIPDSEAAADNQVKMSAYFMGKQSIPSQYFMGDYATHRESTAADCLSHAIGDPFPTDILSVALAPTFTDPGAAPAPTVPTLDIEYAPEMAGGYMSPKPRGVFVGVGMTFHAIFQIPGDAQALDVKSSLWRAPNPQILRAEGTTVADVYERMASDGFAKFMKDFLGLLGAPTA